MKKFKDSQQKGEIIIYESPKKEAVIEVRLENETVWLSLNQIATLFDTDKSGISRHLRNIYQSNELDKQATVAIFATVQEEGKRKITRKVEYYNLDAIISVGYRVNSQKATRFRVWATKILRGYFIRGYAVNDQRLLEARERMDDLQATITFLQEKSQRKLLKGKAGEVLNLLSMYAKTLSILDEYDKGTLTEIRGKTTPFILEYQNCSTIIQEVKKELIEKGEAGDLFGIQRGGAFEGIIANLYQTFSGKELYPSIEDKSSHLLYFIIKDHPFFDGNKRIGAFIFVYYLDKSGYLYKYSGERKINDNALAALALLIAESNPKEKDIMIKLIKHLLVDTTQKN